MRCVADASVALKWLVPEADSAHANRLLQDGVRLHAPHFLRTEVANALWKKAAEGIIEPELAVALHESFLRLDIDWSADRQLDEQTLLLAVLAEHPVYDFAYFMLAAHLGCPLVTADRRFAAALGELGFAGPSGMVVLLEDFDPEMARRAPAG